MITVHETPQSLCRFGLSRCDITPPVGIYHRMWGAAIHDRSTGVHRPLTATAMVFRPLEEESSPSPTSAPETVSEAAASSADSEQILIAIDHCLFWAEELDLLMEAICRENDLQREQVVFQFSHTHAAGLLGLERESLPGGEMIRPYLKSLAQKLAASVREARKNVQPVTITFGTAKCSLARHRDFYDETTNQWVCGFNPSGSADDTVLIARVTDAHHQPLAILVNYGCHPTTLAWGNTRISPDFPGAMRSLIESEAKACCVFLQGASGDVGPLEGFVSDPNVADRNGRQLGFAVLSELETMAPPQTRYVYEGPVVSGATIGTWEHHPLDADSLRRLQTFRIERFNVDLPYPADRPTEDQVQSEREQWQRNEQAALEQGDETDARDCRAMVERKTRWLARFKTLPPGDTFPLPVNLWRMGDAFWVAVEGEPYQSLQTELRQRFPGTTIVVMVLANGSRCWYLPPADIFGKGIYQEATAVLAPGCLEELTAAIGDRIEALQAESIPV